MDHDQLEQLLIGTAGKKGRVTVLTGAGISAESGIPTFRGPEGYWTVGSRVYQPQEMATYAMFINNARAVWQWYLYRLGVCRQAEPNPGHYALVEMERLLDDRFTLVTQNVDDLHGRSGITSGNMFEIHGNICRVRCSHDCRQAVLPLPKGVSEKKKDEPITDSEWQNLHCSNCGQLLRPHVLWFDESYDEHHYRLYSTLEAARKTDLLIVVGTAGATNLPNQVVQEVYLNGGGIIDINIELNRFSTIAEGYDRGVAIRQPSGFALPKLLELLME